MPLIVEIGKITGPLRTRAPTIRLPPPPRPLTPKAGSHAQSAAYDLGRQFFPVSWSTWANGFLHAPQRFVAGRLVCAAPLTSGQPQPIFRVIIRPPRPSPSTQGSPTGHEVGPGLLVEEQIEPGMRGFGGEEKVADLHRVHDSYFRLHPFPSTGSADGVAPTVV